MTLTLLSWCVSIHLHQDVIRSLPPCVVISSINMLRPCQYRNKNQLNCLGGCVRSLTLPNWSVHWMSISSGLTTTALLSITVLQYRNVITVDICNCGSYLALLWSTEMFLLVIIKIHKLAIIIPVPDAVHCTNVNCSDPVHIEKTTRFYIAILGSL